MYTKCMLRNLFITFKTLACISTRYVFVELKKTSTVISANNLDQNLLCLVCLLLIVSIAIATNSSKHDSVKRLCEKQTKVKRHKRTADEADSITRAYLKVSLLLKSQVLSHHQDT